MPAVWLDFAQAAALLGIAAPRFASLIADGALPTRLAPSGTPGVFKSDLMAWQRIDRAERRAALVTFAIHVDREIFR